MTANWYGRPDPPFAQRAPTVDDTARFLLRLHRLRHPKVQPSTRRALPTGKADWCVACKRGEHCKPALVGPYRICRCLNCAALVLEEAK